MTHEAAVIWCVVQATVVACLGVAATWMLARRAPGSASTAAAGSAATILVLTLFAPAPMPRVAWFDAASERADVAPVAEDGGARAEGEAKPQVGEGMDVRRVAAWVGEKIRLVERRAKPQAGEGTRDVVLWIAGASALLGMLRFLASWRYVTRLKRASMPVVDGATTHMFAAIARELGVPRGVELRETSRLASAAVIGWQRPAVLLPTDRADWSPDELRAALAHELAHVARNDFGWRFAASLAAAVHFLNPLVHVLARRLALVQELAADRLAASAAGGPASYLRAISELAVRLDDLKRFRAEPIVLPSFSSSLMRRIAMLRSREGSARSGRSSATGFSAAALIAVVGLGTAALRSFAEPGEEIRPVVDTPLIADGASNLTELFGRAPLDASQLLVSDQGMFVFHLHELSKREAMAPLLEFGNEAVNMGLRQVLGGDKAPTLDVAVIDVIAGEVHAKATPKTDDHGGSFSLNCEDFVIRFVNPVPWKAWIAQYIEGAETVAEGDFEYVKLPGVPELMGVSMLVAERDERTLVFSANVERLEKMARGKVSGDPAGDVPRALRAVDGGLASIAARLELDTADSEGDAEQVITGDDPAVVMTRLLTKSVKQYAWGFDLDPATGKSGVRLTLVCADREKAESIQATFTTLRVAYLMGRALSGADSGPLAVVERADAHEESAADGDAENDHEASETADASETAADESTAGEEVLDGWYKALAASAQSRVEPLEDGNYAVRFEATAAFPAEMFKGFAEARKLKVVEPTTVK